MSNNIISHYSANDPELYSRDYAYAPSPVIPSVNVSVNISRRQAMNNIPLSIVGENNENK